MSETSLNPRLSLHGDYETGFVVSPIRSEEGIPFTFRQVQYPSGHIVLQGGYRWHCGLEGGVIWKALPLIYVDAAGQALL